MYTVLQNNEKEIREDSFMATLRELQEDLLDDPRVADKLRLADNYINQAIKLGSSFALPREHKNLEPIVERFERDPEKFVAFVKAFRDKVTPRGMSYVPLNELYRTLMVRHVQQERRERLRSAMRWLESKYPRSTVEQRNKWLRKLEQAWGKERLAAMDSVRRKVSTGRLSISEREEVLADFWAEIEERVKKGDLPPL